MFKEQVFSEIVKDILLKNNGVMNLRDLHNQALSENILLKHSLTKEEARECFIDLIISLSCDVDKFQNINNIFIRIVN